MKKISPDSSPNTGGLKPPINTHRYLGLAEKMEKVDTVRIID